MKKAEKSTKILFAFTFFIISKEDVENLIYFRHET